MTNWICCPLRNNLAFIRAALPTFLNQDIGDIQVLLLDNASEDGTQQYIGSLNDDRITYVYNLVPKSVAASWNWMLDYVFNHGAEYALVPNADVELRPDTYRWLVDDGVIFVTAVGTSDKGKIATPYDAPDPARKRNHPDFSSYVIRKECWEEVGRFDDSFTGAYCEDSDYHLRMHRAGIQAVCIDLPFYHVGAGTLKQANEADAQRIRENADRNRALFKSKYGFEVGSKEYYAAFGHGAPE